MSVKSNIEKLSIRGTPQNIDHMDIVIKGNWGLITLKSGRIEVSGNSMDYLKNIQLFWISGISILFVSSRVGFFSETLNHTVAKMLPGM